MNKSWESFRLFKRNLPSRFLLLLAALLGNGAAHSRKLQDHRQQSVSLQRSWRSTEDKRITTEAGRCARINRAKGMNDDFMKKAELNAVIPTAGQCKSNPQGAAWSLVHRLTISSQIYWWYGGRSVIRPRCASSAGHWLVLRVTFLFCSKPQASSSSQRLLDTSPSSGLLITSDFAMNAVYLARLLSPRSLISDVRSNGNTKRL